MFNLNVDSSWVSIDEPLRVFGVSKNAVGAGMVYDSGAAVVSQLFVEFGSDQKFLQRVPVRCALTVNYITGALHAAKERSGEVMTGIDIDRISHFQENYNDARILAGNGVDTDELRQVADEAVAREQEEIRRNVSARPKHVSLLRALLLPHDSWRRRRAFQLGLARTFRLRGDQWGFRDIAEAARVAADRPKLGLG